MSSRSTIRDRYSFANLTDVLRFPISSPSSANRSTGSSNRVWRTPSATSRPIKDFTETLQLELEFDPNDEDLRPPPKFTVEECKEKDMTYSAPIFVRARFINANTGEIKEQTVFMGDFPMMTPRAPS